MKKVFTIAFTSLLLFLFSTVNAQDPGILKSFINKNDFVLRSAQKNAIRLNDASYNAAVKSILKLQLISIKFHDSNKELSRRAAYQARQEGLLFLQKNGTVPETFILTEKEKTFFGGVDPINSLDKHLSASELKSVNEMDIQSPAALNSFTTRLQ